ncbi:MAG TPA: HPr(Ser) kinase/phosphatase [Anaerovoracaceae bacterium]|nr:HPr(Ser) kinase/phosphatase [Anaerovoracaceae bacterium]
MGVKVTDLVEEFDLKIISEGPGNTEINLIETNRSGLQLSGFYDYFEEKRIQIIGNAENAYLQSLSADERNRSLEVLISRSIPCIIITNGLAVSDKIGELGRRGNKWILSTPSTTSRFLVDVTLYLQSELAERINQHGDLVDVYGVGVLITGESGMGKSETALDLIRNGHLLIADDAVIIKKIGQDVLMGVSSELTKNLMEIRGIGIININSLFGKRAIRQQKNVELVINLEKWNEEAYYDRVGEEFEKTAILGVELPFIRVPVKPGRNIAAIVEIAALNYRQNLMGYNAARELSNAIKKLSL